MNKRALAPSWIARALVGLTIAAALVVIDGPSPAFADNRLCTSDQASGCASFERSQNRFFVCDYRKDGHSVTVRYTSVIGGRFRLRYATNYWGAASFNGCRTLDRPALAGEEFSWMVCLTDYGRPGGRKMRIIDSTCGDVASERA